MEAVGHLLLFLLAGLVMYGMLAERHGRNLGRFVIALPLFALVWFGIGGILTTAVGYSLGTQVFLGARLYLAWQHKKKKP